MLPMNGTELVVSLLGGVALLLWGVRMVRTGMTRTFGAALRRVLALYSKSRLRAFLAGLGVTTLMQSSTAAIILLASFAGRGLVALPIALATALGADVGTSLAAQIFAFDIKWLWTVMVATGLVLFMASETDRMRGMGRVAIGLGLMLMALDHITATAAPLRESTTFHFLLVGLAGEPLLGFVVAALVTWLAHSSLAIVLLAMSLVAVGAMPMPLALAVVLGANVGGAIAPLVALSGAPAAARRLALGNLLMRAAVALPALFAVAVAAQWLSTIAPDPARAVVNFHTGFNLVVAAIFLPLVGQAAKLAARLIPDRAEAQDAAGGRHLDPNVLDQPSEALACALRQTLALGDLVADMLRNSGVVLEKSDSRLLREIEKSDNAVDQLYDAIKLYLVQASRAEMSEEESRRHVEILTFTTNLEHVGDIIDKNLMELAAKKIKNKYEFSPEGLDEIRRFHARVMDNMRLALNVFAMRDISLARRLLAEKTTMRMAELSAADSHYARLREGRRESIETSAIHLDVIRDLKRINGHLTSVAYPILEQAGELRDSRLREPKAA